MRGKLINREFKNPNFPLDKPTQGMEGKEDKRDQTS